LIAVLKCSHMSIAKSSNLLPIFPPLLPQIYLCYLTCTLTRPLILLLLPLLPLPPPLPPLSLFLLPPRQYREPRKAEQESVRCVKTAMKSVAAHVRASEMPSKRKRANGKPGWTANFLPPLLLPPHHRHRQPPAASRRRSLC